MAGGAPARRGSTASTGAARRTARSELGLALSRHWR
jgi:hypothetical protein